jgi:hypothetical protein
VGHRAFLVKKKIPSPYRKSNPRTPTAIYVMGRIFFLIKNSLKRLIYVLMEGCQDDVAA